MNRDIKLERTHGVIEKLRHLSLAKRSSCFRKGIDRKTQLMRRKQTCVQSNSPKKHEEIPHGLNDQSVEKVDRIDRCALAQATMATKKANKYELLKDELDITLRGFVVLSYKTNHKPSSYNTYSALQKSKNVSH